MTLNDDIAEIPKLEETCSLTFFAYEFSGLFLYPSNFPIKDTRST